MQMGATTRLFSWADYFVFGLMLVISTAIGLYHGCNFWPKKKRRNVQDDSQVHSKSGEFLVANGKMKTLPVALSMLASFLSSTTLIGQPAEVYMFGSQLWLFGFASIFAIPLIVNYFVPFFQQMKLTSAYQYFGKRFSRKLQFTASLLFTLQMVLYLALVLYAPALALHRVTGLNTEVIVTIMYVVVIFYTSVGGMKAVVWSDCFQVLVLYSSMLAIIIKGTIDIGGISVIWQRNYESGRTNFFNWDFDPTERYTMWGTLIGAAFLHTAVYGGNQLQIQRYLTVSTLKQARNMIWINTVGWTTIVFLTVYTGMLVFAYYHKCDPLLSKEINKPDEILPLYVMDVLGEYQGFPGLFVAGVFSAGLSTVSTGLNALAAIWFAELDGTKFKAKLSNRNAGLTVKLMSMIFGLISFVLIFAVPYMGGLAPVAIALSSFFSGSLFGVFLLGMFVPFSNTAGASAGLIAGIGLISWLCAGEHISATSGLQVSTILPRSTEGCVNISNSSIIITDNGPKESAFVLYRISFLWYSVLSTFITVFVGVVVSLMYTFITNMSKKRIPEYFVESVNGHHYDLDSPSLKVGANSVVEETDAFLLKAGKKEPQVIQASVRGEVQRLTNDL